MSTPAAPAPQSDPYGARVRHLHAACQLLSLERPAAGEAAPAAAGPTAPAAAPGLVRAAAAALILFGCTAALAVALWPGARVERVADHRWGGRTADAETADALYEPATGRVVVATRGGGLHTLDPDTGYWRRVAGLPSDDVVRLARGDDGAVYALYESDGARGLCRADPSFTAWENLVGVARFPELTQSNPARVTAVAAVEGRLWVATDRAGVGVYDPRGRGWVARHRAADGGLPDDHVHDLLASPDGVLWAATGGGLARFRGDAWERFAVPVLAGRDVRRLRWREGVLWYATAGGGLGRFGGGRWETLAAESGWGDAGDADVLRACLDAGRDRVWLAGPRTLGGYDLRSRSWAAPVAVPGTVTAVAAGGAGGPPLWAATPYGLFALKADATGWDELPFAKQQVVAVDAAGPTALVSVKADGEHRAAFAGAGAAWRKLTGGGRADVGSRGVLAACVRADGRVVVGTENGVSVYDPAARDWVGNHAPGGAPGAVVDLAADGDRVLALTADAAVRAWNPDADAWSVLAGGGRFPGALADVTAVTRDAAGRLWLAARGKGLHRYDPAARSWADAGVPLKDVAGLAASADGVWAVADGGVHLVAEGRPAVAVKTPLVRPTRVFATPGAPGAVVLDADGRVARVGPAGATVIVGDAAPGLDPAKVTTAGVHGDTVVLGGAKASTFRYDTAARSWGRVPIDDVTQVVPALGNLWLLGPGSKVYALAATPTDHTPPGAAVTTLAGAADQLLALAADGSAWALAGAGPRWRQVRAVPAGPAPGILRDPNLVAAAAGDDLYLSDAGRLWHFNWPGQRWQPVDGPDGRSIGGGPLVHGPGRVFTLVRGAVFSAASGDAKAREEFVPAGRLRAAGGSVAVVVPRESVHLYQNGKWAAVFGPAGRGLPVGDAPVDAVTVPGEGVFVVGAKGAAVLSEGLSGWVPVAGAAGVERVQAGWDGAVWGVSRAGRVSVARKGNDGWRWASVPFPGDALAAALSAGGGAKGDAHWAALEDGSVYRLTPGAEAKEAWRRPSQAPGRAAEMVAAVPTADGFLVAFRGGELAHYRSGPRTWAAVEGPKADGVARLFAVRTATAASYWLLAKGGELYVSTDDPGKGVPRWAAVDRDVTDAAVAGDSLLAVARGEMTRFDATGRPAGRAGGALPRAVGRVTDAGEVAAALVLADGDGLVAYDPAARRWAAHALKAVELHPVPGALIGRTEAGELRRIEWAGGALKVSDVNLGGPVRRVATGADGRILAALADGRVVLGDGRAEPRVLVGAALPEAARSGKVRDVAAVGRTFLLATTDGVYAHDEGRGWQVVGAAGRVTKLAVGGGVAFAQAEEPARNLLRLTEKDGVWSADPVATGVGSWHPVAAGVVAERKVGDGTQTLLVRATGAAEVIFAPTAGPADADVLGGRFGAGRVWLRTKAGELWQADPDAGGAEKTDLGADDRVDTLALGGDVPVVRTEKGALLTGRRAGPAAAWTFQKVDSGVTALDARGPRLAYLTATQLAARRLADDGGKATRAVRSRAWAEPGRLVAAAADGPALWVASDANAVSRYDLGRGEWVKQPAAPAAVKQLAAVGGSAFALGADGRWAALDGGRWVAEAARGGDAWEFAGTRYRVAGGRVVVGDEEPKAAAPLPAGRPARLATTPNALWLEFDDGSLWRYAYRDRRFVRVADARAGGATRTGLVAAGGATFFLAEDIESYVRVADGAELVGVPGGLKVPDVAVTPDGLLVAYGDRGALLGVDDDLAPARLAALRARGEAPAADRQRAAAGWKLEGDGRKLMFRSGTAWHEVGIDAARAALGWDAVTAGLAWQDTVVLATDAGVVVCRPGLAPDAFHPLPAGLTLWAATADRVHAVAADGRFWSVPLKGEAAAPAPGPWRVTVAGGAPALGLVVGAEPVRVSLDAAGLLGLDDTRGVALGEESVFVATRDGVCEFAADLSRLKAVAVAGPVERLVPGERLLARTEGGKTWAFDGKTWQESDADAADRRQLTDRPATGPLRVDLGGRVAEYGRRGFVHDAPTPAAGEVGVTSDGKRVYLATAAGLVVREAGGKLTAVHKVEGGATGLRWAADGAGPLLVRGANRVYALGADGLAEKAAADWDAAGQRAFAWNGTRVTPKESADRVTVELHADAKRPPAVLDLAAGGFRHDRADAVALAGVAWVAYPGHVRRITLAPNGGRESFALGAADQTPALRRVGDRVYAVAAADAYPLDDRDPPPAKPTPDAVPAGFRGAHWRVDGGKVAVAAGAAWHDTGFDPKRGFAADLPRRFAVAGKALVVAAEGGAAYRADLPANGLPALADFVPVAGVERVDDLRAAGDVVFAGGGGAWFRLAGAPPRWQAEGAGRPKELAAAAEELGGTAAARWRRVGDEVRLIEPGPGGTDTTSVLRAGRFDFDHVRAAAETPAGLWLATDAGLWLADPQSRAWKSVRPDARGDAAAFRRQGDAWFLRVRTTGAAERVFRLDGEAARPLTDEPHPFREPEVRVDTKGGLRVTRRDGRLAFEVPRTGGEPHPVAYLPDQGRFDFQVVTDVGADDRDVLTATPAGVVAWTLAAGRADFVAVRTDLKDLPAPAPQDESARWQCRRGVGEAAPTIRTRFRADGPWVELPLHALGGFDYQRAAKVAAGDAGGAWAVSGKTLVRFAAAPADGTWVPDAVWRAEQVGADADFTDVFATDTGACVVLAGRAYTPTAGGGWQPAENVAELLRNRAALAASADGVWDKADGGLRLTRRLAGGGSLEQTFDPAAQRFPADRATDAAVRDGAVWLATPAGVVRVVADTRRTAGLLKSDGAAWTTFLFDRDGGRLMAARGPATGVVLAGTGTEPPTAAGPAPPELLARLAGAAFADADWRFTVGPAPTLTWRGLTSGVRDGRFAHDSFTRLFPSGRSLWTATPVGLVRHDLRPTGVAVAEVLPLPPNEAVVEVVSAGAAVRCAAPGGAAFDWDADGRAWKTVPEADPARVRVLIDTPLWTWTRDAAGRPVVRVKPADAGPPDAVVREDGRFAFDGATAALADPDGAWLAGHSGVVRVGPDGVVRHWFRSGLRDGQAVPLGPVVRLGRFDSRGHPLPSSAPPERLAGSALVAVDAAGGVWTYEPGSPGRWTAAAANPWGAPGGGWVVRTPVFGAWADEAGVVRLRHVTAGAGGPAGPVLRGGRFLADVTRSFAFGADAGYAATPAGVVEFDLQDARPRRLWRDAGGGDLTACADVFAHSGDGRPHAVGPGGEVYGLNDGRAGWAPMRADEAFRAGAEVLVRDEFWAWHRWAGRADARLLTADAAPPGWALFTDGRFSFDALHDIRVGAAVRATTAGGVARFRPADMALEALDRTATDPHTGSPAALSAATRFVGDGGLECEGGGRRFTRDDGRWVWVRAPAEGDGVTDAADGPRLWRVAPAAADGFEVTLTEGGAVVWRGPALRGTPPGQLRAAVAARGRLWLCLERGVYRVSP